MHTASPSFCVGLALSNAPRLIVVEDEPLILMEVQHVLEDAGFEVAVASRGEEALITLGGANGFVGIVTDIRLGIGMSGWEVARAAREQHPAIAVVYVTADSAADWSAYGVPKSALISKPFAGAQLATAMSNLLNEQAGSVEIG